MIDGSIGRSSRASNTGLLARFGASSVLTLFLNPFHFVDLRARLLACFL